jgi:CBS domain-containing protein
MGKQVRDAMTPSVTSALPSQSLADAARAMKSGDVGSVPVLDGDRLVGILTDRDIVVRAIAEGRDPQTVTVDEVLSREPVTVDADQNLDDALELMVRHKVRRLPVTENGRLVGMLAQADIAIEAKPKDVGKAVEEISQPASGVKR